MDYYRETRFRVGIDVKCIQYKIPPLNYLRQCAKKERQSRINDESLMSVINNRAHCFIPRDSPAQFAKNPQFCNFNLYIPISV